MLPGVSNSKSPTHVRALSVRQSTSFDQGATRTGSGRRGCSATPCSADLGEHRERGRIDHLPPTIFKPSRLPRIACW